MNIEYIFLPPMRVVYTRCFGAYTEAAPASWARMLAWAEQQVPRTSLGMGIGLIWDDPRRTLAGARRYDACLPAGTEFCEDPGADIFHRTLKGCAVAVFRHVGRYQDIRTGFGAIRDTWVPGHGLRVDPRLPFVEIYHNDPMTTAPAQLITDLCVPLVADVGQMPVAQFRFERVA